MDIKIISKRDRLWAVLLTGLLILVVGISAIDQAAKANESEPGLRELDLTDDMQTFPEEMLEAADVFHPLNTAVFHSNKAYSDGIDVPNDKYYDYLSVRSFTAVDAENGVVAASFTYRYPNSNAAIFAMDMLVGDASSHGEKVDIDNILLHRIDAVSEKQADESSVSNHSLLKLPGGDGDIVYWFFEVDNSDLTMIMVNGFEEEVVKDKTFTIVGNYLQRRSNY